MGPLPKPTLFEAVEKGDMAAVHDFIESKADVNAVFGVSLSLCLPMNNAFGMHANGTFGVQRPGIDRLEGRLECFVNVFLEIQSLPRYSGLPHLNPISFNRSRITSCVVDSTWSSCNPFFLCVTAVTSR